MTWISYKNVFWEKRVGSAIHAQICFSMLYLKKKRRLGYCHAMVIQILHVFQLIRNKIFKAVFRLFTIPLAFKFTGT